ncbi:hypothetical protein JOC85_001052 [Bacillus mesophilus]|uniref:DUF3231 family protein n=1 Tax=Bacillus mesophilus TaxID=1808955 RepID=A0A6M0Q7B1_9BACI|nr:DUF3231 family protein [Bacillus mesophilus]MBM7660285.1 hypothetical protein [Bacillus mesophilus]NEY70998.1 DUF3231 family protein [Bacillus mesophilus]
MQTSNNYIPLTSGEIGLLWNGFRSETMTLRILTHFELVAEDEDIKKSLTDTISVIEEHIQKYSDIYLKEEFPLPVGFTEDDVNKKAPKLFSDTTAIFLLYSLSAAGMQFYTDSVISSARQDIRMFTNGCLSNYSKLLNQTVDTLLTKGIYVRSPQIPYPDTIDFVQKQNYLAGWFGEKRPIHATQVHELTQNIHRNILGRTLLMGFEQSVKSDKVRTKMKEGKAFSKKVLDDFTLILKNDDLESNTPSGFAVTQSTVAPFSDKLILETMIYINRSALVYYGKTLSISTRRDLFAFYEKLIVQTSLYTHELLQLDIELGYLEEQPMAIDHNQLSQKNQARH